jgi:hypothetical protein
VRFDPDDASRVEGHALDVGRPDGAFGRHPLVLAGGAADRGHGIAAVLTDPVKNEGTVQFTALTVQMRVAAATRQETQDAEDYVHVRFHLIGGIDGQPPGLS